MHSRGSHVERPGREEGLWLSRSGCTACSVVETRRVTVEHWLCIESLVCCAVRMASLMVCVSRYAGGNVALNRTHRIRDAPKELNPCGTRYAGRAKPRARMAHGGWGMAACKAHGPAPACPTPATVRLRAHAHMDMQTARQPTGALSKASQSIKPLPPRGHTLTSKADTTGL